MSVLGSQQNQDTLSLVIKVQKREIGLNVWGKKCIEIEPESLTQEFRRTKGFKTDAELDFLLLNLSNIS